MTPPTNKPPTPQQSGLFAGATRTVCGAGSGAGREGGGDTARQTPLNTRTRGEPTRASDALATPPPQMRRGSLKEGGGGGGHASPLQWWRGRGRGGVPRKAKYGCRSVLPGVRTCSLEEAMVQF